MSKLLRNPKLFYQSPFYEIGHAVLVVCFVNFLLFGKNIYAADSSEKQRAIDIFQRAVEAREIVKSANYIATINTNVPSDPLSSGLAVFDIAFENDKSRIAKKKEDRDIIFCVNCQPDIFAVLTLQPQFYGNRLPSTDKQWRRKYPFAVLSLHELDLKIPEKDGNRFSTYDYTLPSLRDTGMILDFMSARVWDKSIATHLKSLKRSNDISVSDDDVEGESLTKISWESKVNTGIMMEMPDGTQMEAIVDNVYHFWIDPQKNYSVRKIVYKNNSKCVRTLTNVLKKHTASGLWYVESWALNEERENKLYAREEGDIRLISLNHSFPKDFFTLADIPQLEAGMQVDWNLNSPPPDKEQLLWSGKEIVGKGDFRLSSLPHTGAKRRLLTVICINVAIISLIIARVLYVRGIKKQKKMVDDDRRTFDRY